jgi:D-glycero-D-manno-heptose 1,7-bisphosphate phosphatase
VGRPAIFLDRDGVVNVNRADSVKSWEEFEFMPGASQALLALTQLHVPILVVTNQAIISRRLATVETVDDIHQRMTRHLRTLGARIDAVLCCPHQTHEGCRCRKPQPGLLFAAAERYDIDLARSIFVGDAVTDVLAGKRAGCRTVLVLSGRGRETLGALGSSPNAIPNAIASDLANATPLIAKFLRRRARHVNSATQVQARNRRVEGQSEGWTMRVLEPSFVA